MSAAGSEYTTRRGFGKLWRRGQRSVLRILERLRVVPPMGEDDAGRQEQYQLCLWWPGRGLAIDSMRLASLEGEEWYALRQLVRSNCSDFPILSGILSGEAPYDIEHGAVADVARECRGAINYDDINSAEQSALLTLSVFLGLAQDQHQAGVTIVIWPWQRFDTQVYVQPGADLLADLLEINSMGGS